jgi:hypothetical protein
MSNLESPTPARIALALPVVILIGTLAAVNHQSVVRLDTLAKSGVTAKGRVIGRQCNNHGFVYFAFEAAGTIHYGNDSCTASCLTAKVGDPVSVTYSRVDPSNFECRPLKEVRELKSGNYTAIAVLAAMMLGGVFAMTRTNLVGTLRSSDWR